ncbi:CLUMA_CG012799, isoform A [Clunio marinus]|uniref:CLUMA_CG012799, isoform A n=1 Tax=Clunio marinus TaxID=568069 RepID=A0A1J1IIJ4_9DIPT|nr:CLUMA_CG012799, isoform A [Clunio marinus]
MMESFVCKKEEVDDVEWGSCSRVALLRYNDESEKNGKRNEQNLLSEKDLFVLSPKASES